MYDLDSANDRLLKASNSGVGHFCFFLQDPVPFNPSYFYWYDSEDQLFDALRDDLLSIYFSDPKDKNINLVHVELSQLISNFKKRKLIDFTELQKRIEIILQDYENHLLFQIAYIGSYEGLTNGNGSAEIVIRNWFRHGQEAEERSKSPPIKDFEIDDFNDFLSTEK
jgi:hypothetical protein